MVLVIHLNFEFIYIYIHIHMFHASDGWPRTLTLSQLMTPGLDPGRVLEKSPAGRSGQRGLETSGNSKGYNVYIYIYLKIGYDHHIFLI